MPWSSFAISVVPNILGQIAIQAEYLGWKAGFLSAKNALRVSHATTFISNIANVTLYWNDLNNVGLQMGFIDKRLGLIDSSSLNKGLCITTGLLIILGLFFLIRAGKKNHQVVDARTARGYVIRYSNFLI